MPVWIIISATAIYMAALFALAWQHDRQAERAGFRQHPLIYSLALAVYCTSWTYFGAVGTAAQSGWDYLPIYLGPILVFLVLPGLVRRIGDIVQRESITSLSDFLSARYGKSRAVAALASLAAVMGSLPYIALQLQSVGMSFRALNAGTGTLSPEPAAETVLLTALVLALFAIVFGARRSDSTQHNAGLMRVLALEAVVKLLALTAVAALALFMLNAPAISPKPDPSSGPFGEASLSGRFITITLLSMAAIICLPRQFHVAMIERRAASEVGTARWVFTLYLVATSLVVVPITLAGLKMLPSGATPDLFVLSLPMSQGRDLLALFVFLGGFSAASGMVIVATVALSTMVTNDLILPALMRTGRFARLSGDAGIRILMLRRVVILALLLLAYGYYRAAGGSGALAQIGLLSFAAAVQFAPALVGAVYWRGGRRAGALSGLGVGMALWIYTLFLPNLVGLETLAASLPAWLNPQALFGLALGDSLTHGVAWSLGINCLLYVGVSLWSRERLRDRIQAAAFVGDRSERIAPAAPSATLASGVTPDGLNTLASRFLDPVAVQHAFDRFELDTGVTARGQGPTDWRLIQRTERLLASALGASSARVVMSSAIGGMDVALGDVLAMLDQKTQAERFDRHMLQSMLENISQGISVVDQDQRLVAWNSAYIDLFSYPPELVRIGEPIANLIRHNIEAGWIEGDPGAEANRRIAHMKSGRRHEYERQVPDGRWLRITGSPMPGGGYVTSFADITQDKARERALLEANETLEARVAGRTAELQAMAHKLDDARRDAEGANASKTRFLAAASHDLLQPLNAARLFLASIDADSSPDASRTRELVAKTDRAIQSADDLLKGLLDISRLDHGDLKAKPVPLPVGPLLEDLADEAEPMVLRAGLSLRVVPTRLSVMADPDYLTSILRNFLSNARRYTLTGAILVGARRRGDRVRIEVWDTGPGIPADRIDRLFEEFQRASDTDNMGVRGAGLGLSVVRRLAGLMDAQVLVRSRVGRGSVFSVSLPLAEARPLQRRTHALHAGTRPAGLRGLHVLCIDDEPTILDAMQALLERWGCTVALARDGAEARSALSRQRPDAIIADLDLREALDGLGLLGELRLALPDPGNAALLSAKTGPDIRARADQIGVAMISKPVSPDAVRDFLADCASRLVGYAAE